MNSYDELNDPLNSHSCRICLEEDSPDNMIYPCKCKGTAKYVHKNCLNEWRTTATNRENFYRCEMCHYNYKINVTPMSENKCSKFLRFISNQLLVFYLLYSFFIFIFGKLFYILDSKKELFEYVTHTNSTRSDFVQPFYYLFSGFDIFILQLLLISYWFFKAKNMHLYCKLYKKSKNLILNTVFVIVVSGLLFGWLISLLFLELLSLRLFQIHFISIDALHKLNTSFIENYIEEYDIDENSYNCESNIIDINNDIPQRRVNLDINSTETDIENTSETSNLPEIEITNGIKTANI